MTSERLTQLRSFEGHHVSLALADGSRIDDSQLVSAGRNRVSNLWLFVNGKDAFVPLADVIDLWEV